MNLQDVNAVKALIGDVRTVFETPQGKNVMKFLEQACGWYESIFDPVNKDIILINAGKREVVATLKTLLQSSPEQIVAMAKTKEQ